MLSENSENFIVDRNPYLKYYGTEHIKGIKTDFGTDESGNVKIKKLYYPKKEFSREKVEQIIKEKLENCPLCTTGINPKSLNMGADIKTDRNTLKNNDKRSINMDSGHKELIVVGGSMLVGRGIQEAEGYIPQLNIQLVPNVSYKRILNIVAGLGLLLGTQTKYVPSDAKLPLAVIGSKLLADELVDAAKSVMGATSYAGGYAPATVSFSQPSAYREMGTIQVT